MPTKDVPNRSNVHGEGTWTNNRSLRDTKLKVIDIGVDACDMNPICSSCEVGSEPLKGSSSDSKSVMKTLQHDIMIKSIESSREVKHY